MPPKVTKTSLTHFPDVQAVAESHSNTSPEGEIWRHRESVGPKPSPEADLVLVGEVGRTQMQTDIKVQLFVSMKKIDDAATLNDSGGKHEEEMFSGQRAAGEAEMRDRLNPKLSEKEQNKRQSPKDQN